MEEKQPRKILIMTMQHTIYKRAFYFLNIIGSHGKHINVITLMSLRKYVLPKLICKKFTNSKHHYVQVTIPNFT
jgi:heme/copper-type cytochrome/quinol oxidase subunit 3